MKGNPVGWFEIYVSDVERSKAFYQAVLQVEFTRIDSSYPDSQISDMWGFPSEPKAMGCTGALVKMKGEQPTGSGTIVYFMCDDCAVEAGRVEQSGGKIMKNKFAIGDYGFIVLATDPDGTVFGLHSMK